MDILLQKAHAIQTVNEESLSFIQSRRDQKVVIDRQYALTHNPPPPLTKKRKVNPFQTVTSLSHSSSSSNRNNSHHESEDPLSPPLFTLVDHTATQNINDILSSWKYRGEPLLREKIAFEDFIPLKLDEFDDLMQLHEHLKTLWDYYSRLLTDQPESREAVMVLLYNMEIMQVAIGEIHVQTIDVVDHVDGNLEIQESLKDLAGGFKRLKSNIPNLHLNLNRNGSSSAGREGSENIVEFDQCTALTVEQTLAGHSHGCDHVNGNKVYALEPYVVKDKYYLASAGEDNAIALWDLSSDKVITTLTETLTGHANPVHSLVSYTKYSTPMLVSGSFDGTIKLWNLSNNTNIATLYGHHSIVFSLVVFERDSKHHLVSASFDKTIKVWNLDDKCAVNTLKGYKEHVKALSIFYRDDKPYLVCGGRKGNIRIWCLTEYVQFTTLRKYVCEIHALLVVNHDNKKLLATGDENGRVLLWNLENHGCVGEINAHSSAIRTLEVFECKGKIYLVSAGDDKHVNVWNMETQTIVATMTNDVGITVMKTFMNDHQPCLAGGDANGYIKLWME